MRATVLGALLALLSVHVYAHEGEEPVATDAGWREQASECLTSAARQSWGAMAAYAGAPAKFIYLPQDAVMTVFARPDAEIPAAGIYVVDTDDLAFRKSYEEAALSGWKQAQEWKRDGRPRPDRSTALAVFYHGCMTRAGFSTSADAQ